APTSAEAGDLKLEKAQFSRMVFQSAPTSAEAGDRYRRCLSCPESGFNPRPPPRKRATAKETAELRGYIVSIRAHLRGSGRPVTRSPRLFVNTFQSAPTSA